MMALTLFEPCHHILGVCNANTNRRTSFDQRSYVFDGCLFCSRYHDAKFESVDPVSIEGMMHKRGANVNCSLYTEFGTTC